MTAGVRALLVVVVLVTSVVVLAADAAGAETADAPRAFVLLVPDATLGKLLRVPEVAALARDGGAGWMSPQLDPEIARRLPQAGGMGPESTGEAGMTVRTAAGRPDALRRVLARVRAATSGRGGRYLVIVAGTSGSAATLAAKDEMRPIVLARGAGRELFSATGPFGTLTSDSTRRTGVVAAADVQATVDAFIGRSTASEAGRVIEVVHESPPFELHDRYVALRRMWIPVQVAAAVYATIAGIFCIVVLSLGRRAPPALGMIASGAAISVGPLAAALLAAGHLTTLSYATVVPFVVAVTLALVALVLLGATRDVMRPILPLGLALLAFLVVETVLGWTAALTSFLGGSELDGGRFFGLPNVFIGLLLGAALYAAAGLPPLAGFAILVGAAMLAGLPFAGANLGGAVTLLFGAGVWLPLRARGRLGPRELAFALAVVVVGTAVVLVAHRVYGPPTHVTRFEDTGGAGAWSTFVHRLGVGWRLIERNPFALVPVAGVLVTLAVVLRPPAKIAASLARHPVWHDALLVMLLTSVVAYVVNDSGPAACGLGFGMGLGGLLYVSVAEETWKMAPV